MHRDFGTHATVMRKKARKYEQHPGTARQEIMHQLVNTYNSHGDPPHKTHAFADVQQKMHAHTQPYNYLLTPLQRESALCAADVIASF